MTAPRILSPLAAINDEGEPPGIAVAASRHGISASRADNYSRIMSALAEVEELGGGYVEFDRPGVYNVTQKLTMAANAGLVGPGRGAVTIKGNLTTALLSSPNAAIRYNSWRIEHIGFDNTARGTAGGIGVDMTGISHSLLRGININEAATGLKLDKAAYYNQLDSVQVNGAALGVSIGGTGDSTNECLFNNLRINDVVDGVRINNSTNMCFIKPACEFFTGTAWDIAPTSAVQYTNFVAPRAENSGGIGVGFNNRALAQATTVWGGMEAGLATPRINAAGRNNWALVRPGETELSVDQVLVENGLMYIAGGVLYMRNVADSAYVDLVAKNISATSTVNSGSGVTGNRPASGLSVGSQWFDTTLGLPIWWNGTVWKNAAGVTV